MTSNDAIPVFWLFIFRVLVIILSVFVSDFEQVLAYWCSLSAKKTSYTTLHKFNLVTKRLKQNEKCNWSLDVSEGTIPAFQN